MSWKQKEEKERNQTEKKGWGGTTIILAIGLITLVLIVALLVTDYFMSRNLKIEQGKTIQKIAEKMTAEDLLKHELLKKMPLAEDPDIRRIQLEYAQREAELKKQIALNAEKELQRKRLEKELQKLSRQLSADMTKIEIHERFSIFMYWVSVIAVLAGLAFLFGLVIWGIIKLTRNAQTEKKIQSEQLKQAKLATQIVQTKKEALCEVLENQVLSLKSMGRKADFLMLQAKTEAEREQAKRQKTSIIELIKEQGGEIE